MVVLWRFRAHDDQEQSEQDAARVAAVLLFILAAYVAAVSALMLLGYGEPKTTYVGIAVLVVASAIMPWLAKEKRRLSAITGRAGPQSGCRRVSVVRLSCLGRSGWPRNQRDLAP